MKKTTQLSLIFALFFLNALNLEADNRIMNNPFSLVQISSDTATESLIKSWEKPKAADNLIARIDAKIKDLAQEKAQKQAKLSEPNAHLSEKQKDKIAWAIKDLDSRLAELNTSKADMERLGNDPNHTYTFSQTDENCVAKRTDKEIIIQGSNDALFIHEIRHISLWLQTGRNFRFNQYGLLSALYEGGFVDELQGYRAQYAFEPTSFLGSHPTDMAHINMEFIGNIQKNDQSFAYPRIRQMRQDGNKIAEQQAKLKQATQGAYTEAVSH